jgi:hypothetical protein
VTLRCSYCQQPVIRRTPKGAVQPIGPLTLYVMGYPALYAGADELLVKTRRALGVLVRLAMVAGVALERQYVQSLFWPRASYANGSHSLAQAVTSLRIAIGRDAIYSSRGIILLQKDVLRVDYTDRDRGAAFLEGFAIPDARDFEDWRDGWAVRLRRHRVGPPPPISVLEELLA